MTSLARMIARLAREAKDFACVDPCRAAYSKGRLLELKRLKEFRDGLRQEMREQYRHRAEQGSSYWHTRDIVNSIDNMLIEELLR